MRGFLRGLAIGSLGAAALAAYMGLRRPAATALPPGRTLPRRVCRRARVRWRLPRGTLRG